MTSELYPFTAGGIGRLTHDLIRDSQRRGAPVAFHLLLPSFSELEPRAVSAELGGDVAVHRALSLDSREHRERWGRAYPPRAAFTDTPHHADSLELMLALKHLVRQGQRLDVVEFCDFQGGAFCTLQEKRLGLAFSSTRVAVRLHTTDGLLRSFEGQVQTRESLGTHELERSALLEADLVVAHLPAIVDVNEAFYGFERSWREKVKVGLPPVGGAPSAGALRGDDVAFLTKLQQIKRPDLFVRGVATFIATHPAYSGNAVFACQPGSAELTEAIRRLVPPSQLHRFRFEGPQARERLMREAVVVIPSDYESLNLTAYETAQLGGRLVLNQRCPAFGDRTPFVHGANCVKFDGTPEGLAAGLEQMFGSPPGERVSWEVEPPYWERPLEAEVPRSSPARGRVSVLITNFNLGAYLPRAVESVEAARYDDVEIVVVDDASTDPADAQVLAGLERRSSRIPLRVLRNPVNRGLAGSRNVGLRHCTGEFVLPLDADDRLAPGFIELAVRALSNSSGYDVVVPTAGYFLTDEEADQEAFVGFACFLGAATTLGMLTNRFSTATALMRRTSLEKFRYDEQLDSYEDWSLYLHMALAGVRFMVTNEIAFYYRRREGSMVQGIDARRHERLLARIYATLPSPLPASVLLQGLAVALAALPEARRPLRYRLVDRANALLKRNEQVHAQLKAKLERLAAPGPHPQRDGLTDRLKRWLRIS